MMIDGDTIVKVLALLTAMPVLIFLWLFVLVQVDDILFGGQFQGKIRKWSRKEYENKK